MLSREKSAADVDYIACCEKLLLIRRQKLTANGRNKDPPYTSKQPIKAVK